MGIWRLLVTRVAVLLPVALLVASFIFFVGRVLPGDPAQVLAGPQAFPETVERFRQQLGLDKSLGAQYVDFLGDLARGDLGRSVRTGNSVTEDMRARLPASLELATVSFLLAILVSVPLGIWAARRREQWQDQVARGLSLGGVSIPQFWLGLILVYLLYFQAQILPPPVGRLPVGGQPPPTATGLYLVDALLARDPSLLLDVARHIALPALTLAIGLSGPLIRMVRSSMLEVLESDYVVAARAYGLKNAYVSWVTALRNALLPVVTLVALLFGSLVTGGVVIEHIFAWPGLGSYAAEAAIGADYAALQGFVILTAMLYVLIFLLTDVVYVVLDPRTRTTEPA